MQPIYKLWQRTEAWRMEPASWDLTERSTSTNAFINAAEIVISGYTPTVPEHWTYADINGTHIINQDLTLLDAET